MSDFTLSTLQRIITKVRLLTKSPSTSQISDAQISDYINTFILYDFPSNINLNELRTTLTFYTVPYIDVYTNNTTVPTDPLYNFLNRFMSIEPPVYINGKQSFISFSPEEFYGKYPNTAFDEVVSTGNGILTNFTGTLTQYPILRNNATVSSIDALDNGMVLQNIDTLLFTPNLVPTAPVSTLNPITGVYDINFPQPPKLNQDIVIRTVPLNVTVPAAILYFNNTFTIRPVPDQPYRIDLQVTTRPSEMLNAAQTPEFAQ
jgi:hypothetical protein